MPSCRMTCFSWIQASLNRLTAGPRLSKNIRETQVGKNEEVHSRTSPDKLPAGTETLWSKQKVTVSQRLSKGMEATSARRLPCHQTCKATFLSPSLSRCVASENVISIQQKQQQQQQRRRRQLSNNTCITTHTKYINGAALTPIGTCSFA